MDASGPCFNDQERRLGTLEHGRDQPQPAQRAIGHAEGVEPDRLRPFSCLRELQRELVAQLLLPDSDRYRNSTPKEFAYPRPIPQLPDEGTRQVFVKQNAHGPEWSRGPNQEHSAPVPSTPTGTDPENARSFRLLLGSRRASEPELACRRRPECLRKSLDRYARPSAIRPAWNHNIASIPPPLYQQFAKKGYWSHFRWESRLG